MEGFKAMKVLTSIKQNYMTTQLLHIHTQEAVPLVLQQNSLGIKVKSGSSLQEQMDRPLYSYQISWEDWAAWSNLPWGDSSCSRSIWHKQYLVLV